MDIKKVFGGFIAATVLASSVFAQEAAPAAPAAPEATPADVNVEAEEKNEWMPSFDLYVKYGSRYLSKGKVCTRDSMMFYDASISLKGFYFDVWFAQDLNSNNKDSDIRGGNFEEIDYTFGYSYTFEELPVINSLSLGASVAYYDYPKRSGWQCKGSQQWEYAVTADLGVFLSPGMSIAWDSENELWYGNFHAGWDYNFKDWGLERLTFNTTGLIWWGNNHFLDNSYGKGRHGGDNHDTLCAMTFCWQTSFDFAITENITLSPYAELAWALDEDVRDAWKAEDSNNSKDGMNTLYGVKLAFSF